MRVPAERVVEIVDVVADGRKSGSMSRVALVMNQLGLERSKEALDNSVVPSIARAAHARHQAVSQEFLTVNCAGVRSTAIGVMDHARRGFPRRERTLKSRERERRVVGRAGRPTDHAARKQVEHDCQIQPAFARVHVGHVGHPRLVWRLGREIALENIGRDRVFVLRVRCVPEAPLLLYPQACFLHQLRDSIFADFLALCLQFGVHSRAALSATAEFVRRPNIDHQRRVRLLSCRGCASCPDIKSAAGNCEHGTKNAD